MNRINETGENCRADRTLLVVSVLLADKAGDGSDDPMVCNPSGLLLGGKKVK